MAANEILPDLAEFCHATEAFPESSSDLFKLGRLVGRNDVWMHIQENLQLTQEELYSLRRSQSINIAMPQE